MGESLAMLVFLTNTFPLCNALWAILSSFLENELNASVGQVFMVGDGATLILCIGLILFDKHGRAAFINSYNLLLEVKSNIYARKYYIALLARSFLGATYSIFYLGAMIEVASVGNVAAIARISMILFSIGLSAVIRKQIPKWVVLCVIIPLGIVGIILLCQPTFIFTQDNDYSDSSVSWVGVLLTLLAGLSRAVSNLITNEYNDIPWYVVMLYVSIGGVIGAAVLLLFEGYVINDDNDSLSNVWSFFTSKNDRRVIESPFVSNLILISFGITQFVVVWLDTKVFQFGQFIYTTAVTNCLFILFTYLFEWICLQTTLNVWSYIGMSVVIIDTVLYNVQHLYYDDDNDYDEDDDDNNDDDENKRDHDQDELLQQTNNQGKSKDDADTDKIGEYTPLI